MERHFTIRYPNDYGKMWFNKDNLMLCINSYCDNKDKHITASDITDGVEQLQTENAAFREQLAQLEAAAENLLFKHRHNVPLEAVDFEWLERAVGEKA